MATTLFPVQSPTQIQSNISTFNREAIRNRDRAKSVFRSTRYWVYDPTTNAFGPSKFVGFADMTFKRYETAHLGESDGAQFSGGVTHETIVKVLGTEYAPNRSMRKRLITWGSKLFGADAFGGAEPNKWQFVSLPIPASTSGRLAIPLHTQVTRRDVYALFRIRYDPAKTVNLNVGLSPRMPDGGYFLFITLDKKRLRGGFDYPDELYDDELFWTTRQGPDENARDYKALRQESTRISLFVRREERRSFTYLGELRYKEHTQSNNPLSGRPQQRYIFSLNVPVPDVLYARLHSESFGAVAAATSPSQRKASLQQNRKPSTFSETKRAFQYVLGDLERHVNPAHHNYQTRLSAYLESRGVAAEFERDFVDVRWVQDGKSVIGEVKVTGYLTLDQAFRTALGQLLFYAHLQFDEAPIMVMFLDSQPDDKRLALARRLGVVVIAETKQNSFLFCNGCETLALRRLFQS
jgi:hypothetical protein